MARKKKNRNAAVIAGSLSQPHLPMPALLLRVGLVVAAATIVQHFLPQP